MTVTGTLAAVVAVFCRGPDLNWLEEPRAIGVMVMDSGTGAGAGAAAERMVAAIMPWPANTGAMLIDEETRTLIMLRKHSGHP